MSLWFYLIYTWLQLNDWFKVCELYKRISINAKNAYIIGWSDV